MNTIIMLEDEENRFLWAKKEFPEAKIIWTKTVVEFVKALEDTDQKDVATILLDHDLGTDTRHNYGEVINNGKTAACALNEKWNNTAVIVWSVNAPEAQQMIKILHEKSFTAVWCPFIGTRLPTIRKLIKSQLV